MHRTLTQALLGITLLSLAGSVRAGETLNTVDRGWYDYTGEHFVNNQNYWVGWDTTWAYRNWFLFNIPDIAGSYTTATLRLYNPGFATTGFTDSGYNSLDPTENFELRDFTGSIANLVGGVTGAAGLATYNDLGTGLIYGSVLASEANDNSYITIALSPSAITAINAAQGGQFVIGGRLSTVAGGTTEEVLFSYSSFPFNNDPTHTQLLLDGGASVAPEPDGAALLSVGAFGGIAGRKIAQRRRK